MRNTWPLYRNNNYRAWESTYYRKDQKGLRRRCFTGWFVCVEETIRFFPKLSGYENKVILKITSRRHTRSRKIKLEYYGDFVQVRSSRLPKKVLVGGTGRMLLKKFPKLEESGEKTVYVSITPVKE